MKTLEERFWSYVDKKSDEECWEWKGSLDRNGYGEIYCKATAHFRAHKISWMIHSGSSVPKGICVLHKCDNPKCVNPNHLYLGTQKDNAKDREERGRGNRRFLYGEEHPQHGTNHRSNKLSENDVLEIRRLWKTGEYTLRELGEKFGVSNGLINNINHRRKWAWLN
jgi:hypothetical protein